MEVISTLLSAAAMVVVLVVVHELGHFLVAKFFGVEVPIFSVGMGPRLTGVLWRGTDYRISLLPVGGYVRMVGADAFGEEDADDPALASPRSLMAKPPWQRMLIMLAGPGINLLLPFALFTGVMMLGEPAADTVVGRVVPGRLADQLGLREGDRVEQLDGLVIESWADIFWALDQRVGQPFQLAVVRGTERLEVQVPGEATQRDVYGNLDTSAFGLDHLVLSSRVGLDDPQAPAALAGMQSGDGVVEVDGQPVSRWADLDRLLAPGQPHRVRVRRAVTAEGASRLEEAVLDLPGSVTWSPRPGDARTNPWGMVPAELIIGSVEPGSAAEEAGIRPNDRLWSLDGRLIRSWPDVVSGVGATVDQRTADAVPRRLTLGVVREGELLELSFQPRIQREQVGADIVFRPLMGVKQLGEAFMPGGEVRRYYSPDKALVRASQEARLLFWGTLKVLWNLVSGQAALKESVGGPVAIFQVASMAAERGWYDLVRVTGQLSFSLGIVNLLPVPVLDGGHILFYGIEALRGRPLPLAVRERVQMVGALALMALMLVVTVFDVSRLFEG